MDVVALDCELCYTTSGLSLARVTILAGNGQQVLDLNVRPHGAVVDLNTRFSGLTDEDVAKSVIDIYGARRALGTLIGPKTIMIGHGTENDLRALRLVHPADRTIDTAVVRLR